MMSDKERVDYKMERFVLTALIERQHEIFKRVRRKRALRDSERAVWLADIQRTIDVLTRIKAKHYAEDV